MNVFLAYGDEKFRKARDFSGKMAKWLGHFDKVLLWEPSDVDKGFMEKHKETFSYKRGAGLWLWKPYIIDKALREECSEGDFLFYCDSGAFFVHSVNHLTSSMSQNEDIYVSSISLVEWQFTKADCFRLLDCDKEDVKNSAQIQSGFIGIRKTASSVKFIRKWLELCCDLTLLSGDKTALGLQNPAGFVAHREDQSLLSLLCKMGGVKPHRDPSQFGKYPEHYWHKGLVHAALPTDDKYPVCILLHRTPNVNVKEVAKKVAQIVLPRKIGLFFHHKD